MVNIKSKGKQSNTIAQNKRAKFDYHLLESFEAGVALTGWEVKSLRAGRVQLTDSFVVMTQGEAYLVAVLITPLETISTHYVPEPKRARKLLLRKKELAKLHANISQKGLTCVCLALFWKGHLVKARIALAQGKTQYDKRETKKEKDWNRDKARILRQNVTQ